MRELKSNFRSSPTANTTEWRGDSPVSGRKFEKQRIVTPGCLVIAAVLIVITHLLGSAEHSNKTGLGSLEKVAESLEHSSNTICVRWTATQFCSGSGPSNAKDMGCAEEISSTSSGTCICSNGITVGHSCETGKIKFTCRSLCSSAVANPRVYIGTGFEIAKNGIPVTPNKHADELIQVSTTERIRRVTQNTTFLNDVPKLYKYPRMREQLKYAWPSQGGTYNGPKPNAVFLILTVESKRTRLVETLKTFEDHVNQYLQYPYVAFNDNEFSDLFKETITAAVSTSIKYYKIPEEHWSVPSWIDLPRMRRGLKPRKDAPYMDSLPYRLMCRWNSGFFYKEPILQQYDWFWRVDDDVFYYCPITFDPFVSMIAKKKEYGFTIALGELMITIKTLWKTTKQYIKEKDTEVKWDQDRFCKRGEYTGCHFWTNFEIGSFKFFRNPKYSEYFDFLDRSGGFFYERWGDAPVHFLATMLFLRPDQIEYLEGIAYAHSTIFHIPEDPEYCPVNVPERGSGDGIDLKPHANCLAELDF
eukprot:TRINITY_DN9200_c1_g1_i1.p1 TRINITY_DN9200_c1_g1~~TRINITY_DN9200_c1_g1_i1.p1  ORF type:complete len:548 (+),score=42.16 TRINITY_DN9200_c1_g1_i1:60-1646(+)